MWIPRRIFPKIILNLTLYKNYYYFRNVKTYWYIHSLIYLWHWGTVENKALKISALEDLTF